MFCIKLGMRVAANEDGGGKKDSLSLTAGKAN